ncbi:MAG TPA: DUF1345 domain-containing protein [Acidiferrobacteraceae bacterium]|nr:DUF1345 domain-containing protein [Acidiferrobacteraceae bacterium]
MRSTPAPPAILRFNASRRLLAALAAALLTFRLVPGTLSLHTRLLCSWDMASLVYLTLAWLLMARADSHGTRAHVLDQDQSAYFIFLLVLGASCAAIIAIGFLVSTLKGLAPWPRAWHLSLSVFALLSSWALIHTVFAFHYARGYYRHAPSGGATCGLHFPGEEAPDYLDFAYYSFVVGMTSQVSDVVITSRPMRRTTMLHGVLSFVFNIAIVALSINIMATVLFQ